MSSCTKSKFVDAMYYSNELNILMDIFGSKNIKVELERLTVNDKNYPIIDDVIILLDPAQYPESISKRTKVDKNNIPTVDMEFAEDIQFTFGEEWQGFSKYFNLINLSDLKNKRICDLVVLESTLSQLMQDGKMRTELGNEAKKVNQKYAPEKIMKKWEELMNVSSNKI